MIWYPTHVHFSRTNCVLGVQYIPLTTMYNFLSPTNCCCGAEEYEEMEELLFHFFILSAPFLLPFSSFHCFCLLSFFLLPLPLIRSLPILHSLSFSSPHPPPYLFSSSYSSSPSSSSPFFFSQCCICCQIPPYIPSLKEIIHTGAMLLSVPFKDKQGKVYTIKGAEGILRSWPLASDSIPCPGPSGYVCNVGLLFVQRLISVAIRLLRYVTANHSHLNRLNYCFVSSSSDLLLRHAITLVIYPYAAGG